jgi:carboxypeptidase C (cathepsin A)
MIIMTIKLTRGFFSSLITVLFLSISFSAEGADRQSGEVRDTAKKQSAIIPEAEQSITQHKITIDGTTIPYTATARTLIVRKAKEMPDASIGYIAYIRYDVTDPSRRPVTFAYNGGPGSLSIWLNMGALGPKYLLGESYGTTGSAGIVDYLQTNEGISFNGVILVSMATDLEITYDDWLGYDYAAPFTLPTHTDVAWYHKVLPCPHVDIDLLLKEVRTFALGDYSEALAMGNNIPDSVRKVISGSSFKY